MCTYVYTFIDALSIIQIRGKPFARKIIYPDKISLFLYRALLQYGIYLCIYMYDTYTHIYTYRI